MELYEINNNGTLTVSFYKKSKFSNEIHAFKLSGKNADECIKALGKLNVKSFKQIGKADLEVTYGKGKLIIRNYQTALEEKKLAEINYHINTKLAKVGPKKMANLLKPHRYHKNQLVRKANKEKSIANYNKGASLTKKENYEFFVKNNELNCTYASISKMTRRKFSYTYNGKDAINTLSNIQGRVKEFQNLDDKTMEVVYRNGKVYVDDYNELFKRKEFRNIKSGITNNANRLKHKEVKSRFKALNQQSKWVNRIRSLKNFGKKAVCGTTFCSFVLFGTGIGMPNLIEPSAGFPVTQKDIINEEKVDTTLSNTNAPDTIIEPVIEEPKKETVVEKPPVNNNAANTNTNVYSTDYFEFNYGCRASSAENTRNNYQAIINKYSKMYGVDPELMLGIAAHERGTHSNVVDSGGAIGLMQIQVSVWNGASIKVHNYDTNQDEVINISLEKLKDVDFNIRVGTAIFQRNLKSFNYDIIAAIQAYNYGAGGVGRLINNYGSNWMNKRSVVNGGNYSHGDHLYVEHVLSYLYPEDYNIQVQTPNGIKQLNLSNKALETVKTR